MIKSQHKKSRISKPEWLKIKLPAGKKSSEVLKNINEHKLHTICQSGNCPNQGGYFGIRLVVI